MSTLSPDERLNLQKMVAEMGSEDNTSHIRKVKHSIVLRDEIRKLDTFKQKHAEMQRTDKDSYVEMKHHFYSITTQIYLIVLSRMNSILKS